MKNIVTSLMILSLGIVPTQAALGSDVNVELRASVPEICNISSVRAVTLAESTTLKVSASCNAPRFEINLDSVNNLQIMRASAGASADRVFAVDNQVVIIPSQPGGYEIQIELDNSIADLNDLDIAIATS